MLSNFGNAIINDSLTYFRFWQTLWMKPVLMQLNKKKKHFALWPIFQFCVTMQIFRGKFVLGFSGSETVKCSVWLDHSKISHLRGLHENLNYFNSWTIFRFSLNLFYKRSEKNLQLKFLMEKVSIKFYCSFSANSFLNVCARNLNKF